MVRKRLLLVVLGLAILSVFLGGCALFNTPPEIVIEANAVSGKAPLTVSFSGRQVGGNGTIDTYQWSFGDGNIGIGLSTIHTYKESGTFTVVLTVTDNHRKTGSNSQTIEVTNPGPTCDGTDIKNMTGPSCVSPYCVDDTLHFSARNPRHPEQGRYIKEYRWDFGDGTMDYGGTTAHQYGCPGTYTVTLTLTDDLGVSNSFTTPSFSIVQCCCLPKIWIERYSGCLNVGCDITFRGRFSDGCCNYCCNAEDLATKVLDVKSLVGPEGCCPPCPPCPTPCPGGPCYGGTWEWRIWLDGDLLGSGCRPYITVTPCKSGTMTVCLYYTCGGKGTYAMESHQVNP